MQNFILALRNIGRNRRRSLVTILAVALSCGGLALFGGYVSWAFCGVEMQTVGVYGHVQIYKKGFYEEGGGDPAGHALANYDEIKAMLQNDPVIGPRLHMITGNILFNGMVSCALTRKTSTFYGMGVFPSEDLRMWEWNPNHLVLASELKINDHLFAGTPELSDDDISGGSVGVGLGHVLRLDRAAPDTAASPKKDPAGLQKPAKPGGGVDLAFLAEQADAAPRKDGRMAVELLSSPPEGGLPNVATLNVRKLMPRATKEFDDQLIKLHIRHASELLFPGEPLHVTAVIVLLKQSADTGVVTQRLRELFAEKNLDLEFKTWTEIRPFYNQIRSMLTIIFVFVFILLAMLVVFTIYNTQTAGIMERMRELGTLRALGLDRAGLWRLLMLEGCLLGVIGGIAGVLLAIGGDLLLRMLEVTYIPPGVSFHAKVEVLVLRQPLVLLVAFTGSMLCALVSSALPARRAARTVIVDALKQA